MKKLTSSQKSELIEQYVELVVDNMDTKDLMRYAIDGITEYIVTLTDSELKEEVGNYDEELYDELVDNVTETNKNEEYNKLSEIVPERDAKAVENNTSKVIITPDNLTSQSDNEASEIDTLIDNDSFVEHTSECS